MSDYSAWSQLFRLNPDSPQTPMLSNQELQDELALWSNAQFQLEPVAEEPQHKKQPTSAAAASSASSLSASSDDFQQQQQQQSIPWELMMGTSTSDLLSAIASVPSTAQQPWASLASQQPSVPGTPMLINGVPMLPLMPMVQQQQQQTTKSRSGSIASGSSKTPAAVSRAPPLAPAPSAAQLRHAAIMPRGVPVQPLQSPSETAQQQTASQRRTSASAKRSFSIAAPEDSGDEAEESSMLKPEDEAGGDGEQTQRVRAAEEDKRRRNTAASARFRVKKKLKEQALERTAREMTAKAEALEKRVHELETETRWLKSLITEKDPNALTNLNCPCHHPNGLDMSTTPSSASQLRLQQHLNIAPSPSIADGQHQHQALKRSRI